MQHQSCRTHCCSQQAIARGAHLRRCDSGTGSVHCQGVLGHLQKLWVLETRTATNHQHARVQGGPQVLEQHAQGTTRLPKVTNLFQFVRSETSLEPELLELDRDFLKSFACNKCSRQIAVNKPLASVSMTDAKCSSCGDAMRPESIHQVVPEGELASRTLKDLGVPDYDIVKVNCGERCVFVLLNGDRPAGPNVK